MTVVFVAKILVIFSASSLFFTLSIMCVWEREQTLFKCVCIMQLTLVMIFLPFTFSISLPVTHFLHILKRKGTTSLERERQFFPIHRYNIRQSLHRSQNIHNLFICLRGRNVFLRDDLCFSRLLFFQKERGPYSLSRWRGVGCSHVHTLFTLQPLEGVPDICVAAEYV